jgi:hypothetical protein
MRWNRFSQLGGRATITVPTDIGVAYKTPYLPVALRQTGR